jgi:hypothetical protein
MVSEYGCVLCSVPEVAVTVTVFGPRAAAEVVVIVTVDEQVGFGVQLVVLQLIPAIGLQVTETGCAVPDDRVSVAVVVALCPLWTESEAGLSGARVKLKEAGGGCTVIGSCACVDLWPLTSVATAEKTWLPAG